jgi:hypothetical protein
LWTAKAHLHDCCSIFVVDTLLTNFQLMKHLLLLVAGAFIGLGAYGQVNPQPFKATKIAGTYIGSQPCDECDSTISTLDLEAVADTAGTFVLRDRYMNNGSNVITSAVRGEWVSRVMPFAGRLMHLVVLNYDHNDKLSLYMIAEDGSLKRVDENYQLVTCPFNCALRRQKLTP